MFKKCLFCIVILSLFLAACSDSSGDKESTKKNVEEEKTAEIDPKQLIGEHIEMNGSSIELPFDELVEVARFSEDGRVKLFVTNEMIVVIDDTEIVYTATTRAADIYADPTVSADGKYAIWRKNASEEDYTITIFDVENRTVEYVDSTEKYDVFGVYLFYPLIEMLDDEYYLVSNYYLFGQDLPMALNLTTKEMYSREYPEDQELLEKLTPDPIISRDEMYIPIVETWAIENNFNGDNDSYYGYYMYFYEANSDEETLIEQIYAVYTPEAKIIDLELDKHGIDLSDESKEIHPRDDILIADNGSFVFTQYELNEAEDYKMYTYYIDLANTPVEPKIIHESDFDGDKKEVLFNHDAKGIYIVEEGKLNFFELK